MPGLVESLYFYINLHAIRILMIIIKSYLQGYLQGCIYRLFNYIFLMVKFWFLWLTGKTDITGENGNGMKLFCQNRNSNKTALYFKIKKLVWSLTLPTSLPSIIACSLISLTCIFTSHLWDEACREPCVSKNMFVADLNTEHWQMWGLAFVCSTAFQTHHTGSADERMCNLPISHRNRESRRVHLRNIVRLWLFLCEAYFLKTMQIFGGCNVHISYKNMFISEESLLDL